MKDNNRQAVSLAQIYRMGDTETVTLTKSDVINLLNERPEPTGPQLEQWYSQALKAVEEFERAHREEERRKTRAIALWGEYMGWMRAEAKAKEAKEGRS